MFDRQSRQEVTYEASKEIAKPKTILKPRKVRNLDVYIRFEFSQVAGLSKLKSNYGYE